MKQRPVRTLLVAVVFALAFCLPPACNGESAVPPNLTDEKDYLFTFLPGGDLDCSDKREEEFSCTLFGRDFVPSGSTWDPACEERDVFLALLRHEQSRAHAWQLRVGKGGQIYSFIGPFGESVPPQRHPWMVAQKTPNYSIWVDEVWQAVAVCTARNNHETVYRSGAAKKPQNRVHGLKYFIHQAGCYLYDDALDEPFYSPALASHYDEKNQAFNVVNWGQQAHTPSIHRSGALFYTRYRDCDDGVIEVTRVLYNFGDDVLDYLNVPWGGVRTSALPAQLLSRPDGSVERRECGFAEGLARVNETGGFFAWSQEPSESPCYALGMVYGKDGPEDDFLLRPTRVRFGTAGANEIRDYSVFTVNAGVRVEPGDAFFARRYFVVGRREEVLRRSRELVKQADQGMLELTAGESPVLGYQVGENEDTGATELRCVEDDAAAEPDFTLYAWPVESSKPVMLMRDRETGELWASADPYAKVRTEQFENPYQPGDEWHERYENRRIYRHYASTEYVKLLGFAPTEPAGPADRYAPLSSVLKNRDFFPVRGGDESSVLVRVR